MPFEWFNKIFKEVVLLISAVDPIGVAPVLARRRTLEVSFSFFLALIFFMPPLLSGRICMNAP